MLRGRDDFRRRSLAARASQARNIHWCFAAGGPGCVYYIRNYIYVYIHTCVYICIFMCSLRKREREREGLGPGPLADLTPVEGRKEERERES